MPSKAGGSTGLSRAKASIDTGNVKLRTEKKAVREPKPEGPLGELFKAWGHSDRGLKATKNTKSMLFKEFSEMLKALDVIPEKISKPQAQELFRHANRAGAVADGDAAELDWGEFAFAMRKLAERLRSPLEQLVGDGRVTPALASEKASQRRRRPQSRERPEPNAKLDALFAWFAASTGQGQGKRRAARLNSRQFLALLSHLNLMPEMVSKTFAMECFTQGKTKARDQSELDWPAFEWAMKEIASQARIPFDEIHRTSPDHPAAPPPPHPSSAAHAPHPDQPRRPGEERHHAADDEPYDHHDDVPLAAVARDPKAVAILHAMMETAAPKYDWPGKKK